MKRLWREELTIVGIPFILVFFRAQLGRVELLIGDFFKLDHPDCLVQCALWRSRGSMRELVQCMNVEFIDGRCTR